MSDAAPKTRKPVEITCPTGPALLTMIAPYEQALPQSNEGMMIFGGWLMSQCDHAAGFVGRREIGACIIRSFKELTFHAPLQAGEALSFFAEHKHTGRTSAVFALQAWAEAHSAPRLILSAEVILVAIDASGKPRPIEAK